MTLQIALLLIGIVVVALVVFSSVDRARLKKRRYRIGEMEDAFGESPQTAPPASLDDAIDEKVPVLTSRLDINPDVHTIKKKQLSADAEISETVLSDEEVEFMDELESLEQAAVMPISASAMPIKDAENTEDIYIAGDQTMANEAIDFIINLPGRGPISRDRALGIYKQNEYMLEKPRHIYGLKNITGLWSDLEKDPKSTEYSDISLAIQLADHKGAIDESELNTFVQMALKLADALRRPTKLPLTFEEGLEKARALDHFCSQYDVIASVNLVANSEPVLNGRAIADSAAELGLEFGPMDIFHKKNDESRGCRHQFSMANMVKPGTFDASDWDRFRTQGLTFFMHVPSTHDPVDTFDEMMHAANTMARRLGGKLTDQDHKTLTDRGVHVIRKQISNIASDISAQGIYPGSEVALRLFE